MDYQGTISRGIRAPIIKRGDDLAQIVADCVVNASVNGGFPLNDKDVVAVKDYYTCTWKVLSWEDMATILNAIDGKTSFQFTYADPRVPNQFITNTFYVGERTTPALNLNDPKKTWKDLSLKFIRI